METRFGMGARAKYLGAVVTVIRHGSDKFGRYTLISILGSGMNARVCPDMLTPLDPPRPVVAEVSEQAVANFLTNAVSR
jgi:hypothetical protein